MAERLEVDLELKDGVSAPAKSGADALRRLDDQAKKAQKSLDFTTQVQKSHASLAKLKADPGGFQKLLNVQKELREEQARLGKTSWASKGAEEFGHKLRNAVAAAAIGELFLKGAEKAVDLLKEGITKAFEEGGKAEKLRLSFGLILGKEKGAGALEDIGRFSKQTRFDDDKVAEMMRPLLRAGLSQKSSRTAFATATDLDAMGVPIEDAIGALNKIALKGGITEKQLVALGIPVETFGKELASATKLTKKEAMARAESGKLDRQVLLNAVTSSVNKMQGGEAGSSGEKASTTMEARLEKLGNLPNEYLKKMSESPAWQKLSDKLGMLLEGLDPDGARGKKIMSSLFAVFNRVADWVSRAITPENIDKFAAGCERAINYLQQLPAILDKVITATEVIATIWGGTKLVNGIAAVASGLTAAAEATAASGVAGAAGTAGGVLGALATPLALGAIATMGSDNPANDKWLEDAKKRDAAKSTYKESDVSKASTVMPNTKIEVNVYPAKDDTAHTGQAVAESIHKHTVNAFEQAVLEGGG